MSGAVTVVYTATLYHLFYVPIFCGCFLVSSQSSLTHFMQDYRSQWSMLNSAWLSLWWCSCWYFRWVSQSRKWIHHSHLARIYKWVYRLCGGSLKLKHISYCLCRSLSEFCVLIIALVSSFEAKALRVDEIILMRLADALSWHRRRWTETKEKRDQPDRADTYSKRKCKETRLAQVD